MTIGKPCPLTGLDLIAAERGRQIVEEGWSSKHDDAHNDDELAAAASVYAAPLLVREFLDLVDYLWPWHLDDWKPTPDDRMRELVKAGALIAAEIDRLLRRSEDDP